MEFGGAQQIRLKAWVTNQLAIYLEETPLAVDQKIQFRKGRYLLTAKVNNSWQTPLVGSFAGHRHHHRFARALPERYQWNPEGGGSQLRLKP